MTNKFATKAVFLCLILPSVLAIFVAMSPGVSAQAVPPTIDPAVPGLTTMQDTVYCYDLSRHENDNIDTPVPPIISVSDQTARIYYIQCDGVGGFGSMNFIEDIGLYSRATAVADFDNDGDYDIVAGHSNNNEWYFYLYYFENTGTPTAANFPGSTYIGQFGDSFYLSNYWAMDMAAADYNNDGNMDFTVNVNSPYSWLFLGDGNFGFADSMLPDIGTYGRGADAGDVDGDGDDDIVMARYWGGLFLYTNNNGDFHKSYLGDIGDDPYTCVLADFNDNGNLDIIVNWGSNGDHYLAIGNGDGTFGSFNYINTLDTNRHTAGDAYDFNGDGYQDMISSTYDERRVWYYPGIGDGTFGGRTEIGAPSEHVLSVTAPHMPLGSPDLTWSVSDVDTGLFDSIVIDPGTDVMTITPVPGASGWDKVLLTLTNSLGGTETQWVTIAVSGTPGPNDPFIYPRIPDQILDVQTMNLDLTPYENDVADYQRDITLNTPTTVADYQVKVVLNTGNFVYGHARADGGDIRFYDGGNSLSYWIESWNPGGTSTIWVLVPDTGTDAIVMEYGDPLATSQSDGEATFPTFFDDFEDGTIDPVKWPTQVLGGQISEDNGKLMVNRADPDNHIESPAFSSANLPYIVEANAMMTRSPGNGWSPVMWYQGNSEGASILDHGSGWNQYVRNDGTWYLPATNRPQFDWHINRLTLPGTGTWTASVSYETHSESDWSAGYTNTFSGSYYLRIGPRHDHNDYNQPMNGKVDWVRVRNYMAAEPVATVGSEAGAPGSLTWSVFDADPTLFTANMIDVPNDILQLDLALNAVDGADDILLVLTDSDGLTDQQWVTVFVHAYPYVFSIVPSDGEVSVPINRDIIVVFDQPMNTGTVGFTCSPDPGVTISWNAAKTTMYIQHNDFAFDTVYTCEITSGTSMTGRNLIPGAPNPWTFTTVKEIPTTEIEGEGDGEGEGDDSTTDDPTSSSSDLDDILGPYSQLIAIILLLALALVFLYFLIGRRKKEEEEPEEEE